MTGFELIPWASEKVFDIAISELWRRVLNRRAADARAILIEELEAGRAYIEDVEDLDEAAAMIFEYAEAAKRGAARRNLRLIAQVMANRFCNSPPLYADEFLQWSTLLASLSREEVVLAATMHKVWKHPLAHGAPGNTTMGIKSMLIGVNKLFADESDYEATAFALTRTGLIIPVSAIGGTYHQPTKRLERLADMANLNQAAGS